MDCGAADAGQAPQPDDYSADYPHVPLIVSDRVPLETMRHAINESVSDPTLSVIDRQIERTCKAYLAGADQQRSLYRQGVKNGFSLLHYPMRMAVRAMRNSDAGLLELAGAALSLEDMRKDPRETIIDLAVLRHVAMKIGVDWNSILRGIEVISSSQMAQLVSGFRSRDPSSLGIELFLHRETLDANGPTIELQPPPPRRRMTPGIPPGSGQVDVHL